MNLLKAIGGRIMCAVIAYYSFCFCWRLASGGWNGWGSGWSDPMVIILFPVVLTLLAAYAIAFVLVGSICVVASVGTASPLWAAWLFERVVGPMPEELESSESTGDPPNKPPQTPPTPLR